ncbi:MAG: SDR family NAD(P)-dependent oxidoreductase, partial [Spirochaetales bacterium]|nr:SDR family NAD(P)-dependent oxidoreductase [Spirochaetales bacterium]
IAMRLASDPQNSVILIGKNREKCEEAVINIRAKTRNPRVEYDLCDLSRKVSIDALFASTVSAWSDKPSLDVLINNAAAAPRQRKETPEGLELQWATNVLGYFWMMETFLPLMKPGGRIVNVASYWAGGLDLTDPMYTRRPYTNTEAYRACKQADRMLTRAFAARMQGITVNACHPGDVNSALSNNLGFGGSDSAEAGADTPLWLALSPETEGVSGRYFEHRKAVRCHFMDMKKDVDTLYSMCREYTD